MLVLSIILLVTPLLFNSFAVFPMFSLQYSVMILGLFALFATGFVFLISKLSKVKRNLLYLLAFVGAVLIPIVFGLFAVTPFLASAVAWMYMLMHFVFAAGAVMLYTQRSEIKKLF